MSHEEYSHSTVLPAGTTGTRLMLWVESVVAMMAQRGVPAEEIAWFTEEGPKGLRRVHAQRIMKEQD